MMCVWLSCGSNSDEESEKGSRRQLQRIFVRNCPLPYRLFSAVEAALFSSFTCVFSFYPLHFFNFVLLDELAAKFFQGGYRGFTCVRVLRQMCIVHVASNPATTE